ncbi:MAG TPA: hypothetical protein VEC19_11265 [Usitatibacter sp.]|nr:hypothetical protein [Usitatibacter sp.]
MRLATAGATAALLFLAACSEPLPQARLSYVGHWQAEQMRLSITPEGMVDYERRQGGSSKSIKAPIKRFEGDNFVVGIGPFTTTFVVTRAPFQEQGVWKMVVDGVELSRRGHPGDLRAEARA